ncbi:hypothetical protein [Pontimicrobium sp. MEBiC01747]
MKNLFKISILFLLPLFITGQEITTKKVTLNHIPIHKERVNIITNTEFLLTGESIYYSFHVFEGDNLSTISKIGYVELVGANKNQIIKHKLRLKNGMAQGDIFVPTKVKTGHYKLIGYTNWTKNNTTQHSFVKDIFIINPFSTSNNALKNDTAIDISKKKKLITQAIVNKDISISTSKTNYKTREKIRIDILSNENKTIKNGNYTLSVRKLDSVYINNSNSNNYISLKNSNEVIYIPELRGELISGKITNIKNTKAVENVSISLSVTGENYIFKIAKTNKNGVFYFNLTEDYQEEKGILQIIETNKEDYKIELNANKYNNYEALTFNKLKLDPELKQNIEQRSIQNQIDNAYYEKKQDSLTAINASKPFYYPLGKEYLLDDYTRFKTVRETFIEVILDAAVRVNNESSRFIVYDYQAKDNNSTISSLKPLVLVDGIIIDNNDDLLYYNCDNIKKITIVRGQYLYGAKLFDGIIDIETYLKDFKSSAKGDYIKKITLEKPIPLKNYYQPDYSSNKTNRIPDYRRQLLWVPNVSFTSESLNFNTYASDNTGTYQVLLQGYDANGNKVTTTSYFTISK